MEEITKLTVTHLADESVGIFQSYFIEKAKEQ
jgi:hypothetical protein